MKQLYDVIIIGGGVIGSAIARDLSRYQLKICVLEKNLDVCYETSGRNSGVVHAGFAYDVGSLKAKLCVEGNRHMGVLAEELGFPFRRCGKILVGSTPEDRTSLESTLAQGMANGVSDLVFVDKERIRQLVPDVQGEFGLYSPSSGIVDPFLYTIAFAENASANGVEYFFNHEVTAISLNADQTYLVTTTKGTFYSRWIVNSSGLSCGKISDMLGITGYTVVGSKGDYIILDKRVGAMLPMPIYPVPNNFTMGIHLTNTIDGNVLVGPSGGTTMDMGDYSVPGDNIEHLSTCAFRLWPHIQKKDYIRNYSGLLAKRLDENGVIQDFKIEIRDDIAPHAINLVGIESPGLTAAYAIARYAIALMREREKLEPNTSFNPIHRFPIRLRDLPLKEQAELIRENPDYGEVICRCEQVTKAEVLQAIHNPLGVHCVTGIKYRTRAMMGRCQGGYCQMRLTQIIEKETGEQATDLRYARADSQVFFGKVRQEAE